MLKLFKQGQQILLALLALIILWVVTSIALSIQINAEASQLEYVQYIMNMTPLFVISYANASLITVVAVLMFYLLMRLYSPKSKIISLSAFAVVAVYGLLNLFVYVSQFAYLPLLSHRLFETDLSPDDIASVYHWIHLAPGSNIALLNGLAYALLGIPSIVFGLFLIREDQYGKKAAVFLTANAVFCFLGFAGVYYSNKTLGFGLMLGGFFFILAVFYLYRFMLRSEKKHQADAE